MPLFLVVLWCIYFIGSMIIVVSAIISSNHMTLVDLVTITEPFVFASWMLVVVKILDD